MKDARGRKCLKDKPLLHKTIRIDEKLYKLAIEKHGNFSKTVSIALEKYLKSKSKN